jgi:hypothetical protein
MVRHVRVRLPMETRGVPLPIMSCRYDDAFWKELLGGGKKSEAQNLKELGF